ncbi:MAG: GntR family transcriptional regulator [Actinomycetes bacterium]
MSLDPTLFRSLADARASLARTSTAQRLAGVLREKVVAGALPPGTQLSEQHVAEVLEVSRNTLREAFQVLIAERLLVHEPNRGVFVRRLSQTDVADIYRARRLVECGALSGRPLPAAVDRMRAAVHQGQAAGRRNSWSQVATADLHFHTAVTALAGSERLDAMVRGLFAELRLAFHLAPSARQLHQPFVDRNAEILELVEQRKPAQASRAMRGYLDDAERRLVAAVEAAA